MDEDKNAMIPRKRSEERIRKFLPDLPQEFMTTPLITANPRIASKIALYHYVTKSFDDFVAKTARGSGMSKAVKGPEFLEKLLRCALAFTRRSLVLTCDRDSLCMCGLSI